MNIDIKNIVKTIARKKQGLQDPQLIYPARDWAIGMVGTLGIVCFAVAFCVIQYHSYTNMSLDEEVILTMVPYRTAQVEKALVKYRTIEATHLGIISTAEGIGSEDEVTEEGLVEDGGVTESDNIPVQEEDVPAETAIVTPELSI